MPRPSKKQLPKDGLGSTRIRVTVGEIDGEDFGRLELRTGTTDPKVHAAYVALVDKAIATGDADVLRSLKQGGKDALQQIYRRHMANMPLVVTSNTSTLAAALTDWAESVNTRVTGKALSPKTRRLYAQRVKALIRFAKPHDGLDKLGDVLFQYRKHCEAKGFNFPFNQTRTMCLSFAARQDKRGKFSPLYLSIAMVPVMHMDRKKERDSTCTPRRAKAIMLQMQRQGNGHLAHHVWNHCALACRPDEYLEAQRLVTLYPERNAAMIMGTKNTTSRRFVPCIDVTFPSYLAEAVGRTKSKKDVDQSEYQVHTLQSFRKALRKACKGRYTPIDLRASGRSWYRLAGIEEVQAEIYHGHAQKAMNKRYQTKGNHDPTWYEWKDDVERDVKLLKDYISDALSKPVRKEPPATTFMLEGVGEVRMIPDFSE